VAEIVEEVEIEEEPTSEPYDDMPEVFGLLDRDENLVGEIETREHLKNSEVYQDAMDILKECETSMQKWKKKYNRAINLAKMVPTTKGGKDELESKDFPFEGASLAMLPYIFEAMLDFSSRASPELVWSPKLVKAKVWGQDQEQTKLARAMRVETYMNYQLQETIPQWKKNQDKGLLSLPCTGTIFKKTYFDSDIQECRSDLKMADEVIFDHNCESFEESLEKFEKINYTRNETIGMIRGEDWNLLESELDDEDRNFDFIEAHIWIDLDDDGLEEPYTAILDEERSRVVALYPDYEEDTIYQEEGQLTKIEQKDLYTQFVFLPDPEGGPMGMGWGILLGPMFTAINTLLRDNLDAGTLQLTSSNSGLIATGIGDARGNRQLSGPIDIKLGKLTPIPLGAINGTLQQNVVQFPFGGPSQVLLELMTFLVESSKKMTSAAYAVEAHPGEAATLYLARLQQALKTPNTIIMRVYSAQRREYKKIALVNYEHFSDNKYNKVLDDQDEQSMQADFNPADCDIDLVADPSQGSEIERVAKAQNSYDAMMSQLAYGQTVFDQVLTTRNLLLAMGESNATALVPDPPTEPSEQEKLAMANQMREAELENREMDLKEATQRMEGAKLARIAAKDMSELGLRGDKDEAEITERYVKALKDLVEMGMSYSQAKTEISRIEEDFIEGERNVANPIGTERGSAI
jgi:hypothetical protein